MPYDNNSQQKHGLRDGIEAPHVIIALLALAIVAILIWLTHKPVTMHGLLLGGELVLAGIAVVATATYKSRAEPEDQVPATVIFNVTLFLVGGLTVVSLATFHSGASWAASMIWSLACLALGSTAGFLFGIPRSRVPGTAAHAAAAAKTVTSTSPVNGTNGVAANADQSASATPSTLSTTQGPAGETALEQISDWLTKIIVGVGLTNLTQMPFELNRWANYVAISLDPARLGQPDGLANGSTKNFALGLIFYFCILGLISGYLLTQMFLLDFINKMGPTPKVPLTSGPDVQNSDGSNASDFINKIGPIPKLPPTTIDDQSKSGGQGSDGSTAAGGTGGTGGGAMGALPAVEITKPAPAIGFLGGADAANRQPVDAAPPVPAELLPVAPQIIVPPPPDVAPLPAPVPVIIVDAAPTEPIPSVVAEVPPAEPVPDAIPASPEPPAEAVPPPAEPAQTDPATGDSQPSAGGVSGV